MYDYFGLNFIELQTNKQYVVEEVKKFPFINY